MTDVSIHNDQLGRAARLLQAGQLAEAETLCHEILAADSGCAAAHQLLTYVYTRQGAPARAAGSAARAVQLAPTQPELHMSLANALMNSGDAAAAADAYAEAARLKPGWFQAVGNRGIALARLRRYAEAEAALNDALALKPDNEAVLTTLAGTLQALGRSAEAADAGRKAVAADPAAPEAWTNLGLALHSLGQLAEAKQAYERAIVAAPAFALAWYDLGHVLSDQWRAQDARRHFQRAVELDSGYGPAWHAMLFHALCDPSETEQTIYEAHVRWARTLEPASSAPTAKRPAGTRQRIRVGYVSPDFRAHSCAAFLRPLFANHDPAVVEIFAYSAVARADDVTDWFRSRTPHWRNIHGLADQAIAALVRSDGIDILVDLGGHTRDQPLGAFALKPAPVQVAWLGYPATTGLAQIDFRFTDDQADPGGDADRYHAETLIRLAGGFHCFEAPDDAPPVAPPPSGRNGCVTFGSFNSIGKVTPESIETWAGILLAVPESRLLLKARMLGYEDARSAIHQAFERAGVAATRVELRNWVPRGANPLAAYGEVDIALDTFPYNGTTTTFEALWMGVPVIALRGQRHAARVGASILTHIGSTAWITDSTADYQDLAVRLASDLPALASVRRTLRARLASSSLADGPGFARKLEAAYRDLLQRTEG